MPSEEFRRTLAIDGVQLATLRSVTEPNIEVETKEADQINAKTGQIVAAQITQGKMAYSDISVTFLPYSDSLKTDNWDNLKAIQDNFDQAVKTGKTGNITITTFRGEKQVSTTNYLNGFVKGINPPSEAGGEYTATIAHGGKAPGK
ncbi:hypothetical protein [Streptomyces sp. NPDC051183]|uniref:hypothetical protein n=1 Tax=unclassified Streptomyces TaxID=2593676 RepID=UPI0034183DAA